MTPFRPALRFPASPLPTLAPCALALCLGCAGLGPVAPPGHTPAAPPAGALPWVEEPPAVQRVTCYGDTEEAAYGSRRERGPLLVDPQERYRARVESEALAYPEDAGGGQPHCLNRSRLYLVRDGEEEEIVLALAPFDGMTGNAIRLVDWSPDGERLLLETSLWTYNAEFENPDILVLHAAQGVIEALDLQGAVARQFGADCHLAWRGLGFTAEGAVAVETLPAGELFGPSCESHASQWRLDTRQRLHRLPVDLPVATYGRHQARAGHP